MKRLLIWLIAAVALAGLPAFFGCADAAAEDKAEWTVMFYLCGSDLEADYGYASALLKEIKSVPYPYNKIPIYTEDNVSITDMMRDIGRVNILIETGGAEEWHAQSLGMDISPASPQRWRYDYIPLENGQRTNCFTLLDTLAPQSMGEADTLADFVRWSAEAYPAKKYALVLWDHGGGAATGLCFDELFQNDALYLYELRKALADSGVYLETVIMDACLMANIETACALRGSAHWMVASEEIVPGDGSAVGDWLRKLVSHPVLDGAWLGRCVCDTTEEKYDNLDDAMSESLLTWSVTDLTKIGRLAESVSLFFRQVGESLTHNPRIGKLYAKYLSQTDHYGDDLLNMRSLGSLIYNRDLIGIMDNRLLDEMMDAFSDAVVYVSRGSGRSAARGLSFCYPAGFSDEALDLYAKNFPMPSYLAYLDAISPWEAPDSVYDETVRLPEIDTIDDLQITIGRRIAKNGMPVLSFGNSEYNLDNLYYRLYRQDEKSRITVRLGRTDCTAVDSDENGMLWGAAIPSSWPAINGELCCTDLVQYSRTVHLYNIPVQIELDTAVLRCGQTAADSDAGTESRNRYDIYGIWLGYNENSKLMSRSVKPLSAMFGRDFRLLYPFGEANQEVSYTPGEWMILGRALQVDEIQLPVGTYYLEYELVDMFLRTMTLEKIELHWDGKAFSLPDGFVWQGAAEPEWNR